MKQRFLAILLSLSMVFQTTLPVYATAATVSGNDTNEETTLSGNDLPAEDLPQEDLPTNEEPETEEPETEGTEDEVQEEEPAQEIEDASISDNQLAPETSVSGNQKQGTYAVDTSHNLTVSEMEAYAQSYAAEVLVKVGPIVDVYPSCALKLMYTTDSSKPFFPDVTEISLDHQELSGYTVANIFDGVSDTEYINGDLYYLYKGKMKDLEADTTYHYRLICEQNGKYYFHSERENFTTKPPVTETKVNFQMSTVMESGYHMARIRFVMNNEENESVINPRIATADAEEEIEALEVRDRYGVIIPNTYEALVPLKTEGENSFYPQLDAQIGKPATVSTITGGQIKITKRQLPVESFRVDEIEVSGKRASIGLEINPYYACDSNTIRAILHYREQGTVEWKSVSSLFTEAELQLAVNDLIEHKNYDYYVEVCNRMDTSIPYYKSTEGSFTTGNDILYTEADFPDAEFLKLIRVQIGNAELKPSELEKITSLKIDSDEPNSITSIAGIQYLTNLEKIDITGQKISDVEQIKELKKLYYIRLENNEIQKLPDLKGLTQLEAARFSGNRIPASEFVTAKLPARFVAEDPTWIDFQAKSQRKAFSYLAAPTYYAIADTHPFFLKVEGLKKSRTYRLEVTVGGEKHEIVKTIDTFVSAENPIPEATMFELMDLGNVIGKKSVQLLITDVISGEVCLDTTIQTEFVGDLDLNPKLYLTAEEESTFVNVDLKGDQGQIAKMELLDQQQRVVGSSTGRVFVSTYNISENRYFNIFGPTYIPVTREVTNVGGDIYFPEYLQAGTYTMCFTRQDGTQIKLADIVEVNAEPVLAGLMRMDNYIDQNEFVYVTVKGANLDKEKLRPVIIKDGKTVTRFERLINGQVYCLKILDESVTEGGLFDWEMKTIDGYQYTERIENTKIYLNTQKFNYVSEEFYNYKTGLYTASMTKKVPDGTKVEVELRDINGKVLLGKGSGITDGGKLEVVLKDTKGKEYRPVDYLHYRIEYRIYGKEQINFGKNKPLSIYGAPFAETSGIRILGTMLYERIGYKADTFNFSIAEINYDKDASYTAVVRDKNGKQVGNTVNLANDKVEIGSGGEKVYHVNGAWASDIGLTEGHYTLYFLQNEKEVVNYPLAIYDKDQCYLSGQNLDKNAEGKLILTIYSPAIGGEYKYEYQEKPTAAQAKEWWNTKLDLEIYDVFGTKLTGWELGAATYKTSLSVEIKGLPARSGYYVKVKDKQGNPPINLKTGNNFYAMDNESSPEYGKYTNINGSLMWFLTEDGRRSSYSGFRFNAQKAVSFQITFTDITGHKVLKELKASSPNGHYYFTKEDLKGLNSNTVYQCMVRTSTGVERTTKGMFGLKGVIQSGKEVTSVTLEQASLSLSRGEKASLKATLLPTTATNKTLVWKSSNPSVASVDARGTIEALGSGITKITATAINGIEGSCLVNVSNAMTGIILNKTEVTLETGENTQLNMAILPVGAESKKFDVWNSSNTAVATVVNGKVRAVAKGEATIRVTLGDFSASCKVIVEEPLNPIKPQPVIALGNLHTELSQLALPEGWTWKEPKTKLTGGYGESYPTVIYTEGERSTERLLKVTTVQIQGIQIESANGESSIQKDSELILNPNYTLLGGSIEDVESLVWLEWKVSDLKKAGFVKESVDVVNAIETESTEGVTLQGIGAGKITVTAMLKGKTPQNVTKTLYQKTFSLTVIDAQQANISAIIDGAAADGVDRYVITDKMGDYYLEESIEEGFKATWKISDSNIATLTNRSVQEDGSVRYKLNVKQAGYVELIGTLNDAWKSTTTLQLKVVDPTPQLESTRFTMNKAYAGGIDITMLESFGYAVQSVSISDTNFEITKDAQKPETYNIRVKNADLKPGTYKTELSAKVNGVEESYVFPVQIKVEDKKPVITMKQSQKVNLFYTDQEGNGSLQVSTKGTETITKITLEACDFTYDETNESLRYSGANPKVIDKQGILKIQMDGYEPIEKSYNVSYETKKPVLSLQPASATVYPQLSINYMETAVVDKLTKQNLVVTKEQVELINSGLLETQIVGGKIRIIHEYGNRMKANNPFTLMIQLPNWRDKVMLKGSMKANTKEPTLQLGTKAITLNMDESIWEEQEMTSQVSWKDNVTFAPELVWITAKDAKTKALLEKNVAVSYDNGMLTAKIHTKEGLVKGNHTLMVNAKSGGKTMSTPLKLSIINTIPSTCLSLSPKGNIDLLDRANTMTTYTIKKTGLTGEITDVRVIGAGMAYFDAVYVDGKVEVRARENVKISTKYAYPIQFSLQIGEGNHKYTVQSKPMTLKVTQVNPKITAPLQTATIFKTSRNVIPMTFGAYAKSGEAVTIAKVALQDKNNIFAYSEQTGEITLEEPGKVAKGKTYTLEFKITYQEKGINEKEVIVKKKVIVK